MVSADRDKSEQPAQTATRPIGSDETGTGGNRYGPDGYRCCTHCAEDGVHDVDPNHHKGPCQTCDDPGAMLRERVAELERALADERAKVARVEAWHSRGETWYYPAEGEVTTDDDRIEDGCQACGVPWPCATIAALAGPEPEVPRCQNVSASPWGPTQCALPEHDESVRHAYSPSETSDG